MYLKLATLSVVLAANLACQRAQAQTPREMDDGFDTQIDEPVDDNLESGTAVNNGMGPMGRVVDCESDNGAYSFNMERTALITYNQATLTIGKQSIVMICKSTDPTSPEWSGAAYPWSCTEYRSGEGLYHLEIFAPAQGAKTFSGVVSIDQMYPLKPYKLSNMTCRDPSSK